MLAEWIFATSGNVRLCSHASRRECFLWWFLLAAAWLLTTPYSGIWHDGNLYALQALHRLNPQAYAKELFFEFGSQDDFTLFSRPYAFLIGHLGLKTASLLLFCTLQALWLGGAIRLFRSLLPEIPACFCVLFLAVSRHHYGGFSVFSYAEGFLTARLAAEAIALWALAMTVEKHQAASILLAFCSLLMHPLIGIWALLPAALRLMPARQACFMVGAASLLIIALALANLGPPQLTAHFDAAWLWLLHDGQVPYLFLDTWTNSNLQQTAFCCIVLVLAARFAPPETRSFWQILLLLVVSAFFTTLILGSMAHNILVTQLQPWRILWVVQTLQWVALCSCLYARRQWILPGLLGAALFLSYVSNSQHSSGLAWLLLALLGGIPLAARNICFQQLASRERLARHARKVFISLAAALTGYLMWNWLGRLHVYLFDTSVIKGLVFFNVLPPALAMGLAGLIGLGSVRTRTCHLAMLGTAVICLEFGLLLWDERRPLEQEIMTCAGKVDCPKEMKTRIPAGSLVYWEDQDGFSGAQASWFYAGTATYLSGFQSSSRAFNRQLAMEDERRRRLINDLPPRPDILLGDTGFKMDTAFASADQHDFKKPLDQRGIQRLCTDARLDFIVADAHIPVFHPWPLKSFQAQYVYACAHVRDKAHALAARTGPRTGPYSATSSSRSSGQMPRRPISPASSSST